MATFLDPKRKKKYPHAVINFVLNPFYCYGYIECYFYIQQTPVNMRPNALSDGIYRNLPDVIKALEKV